MEQATVESVQNVNPGKPMITQGQWGAIETLRAQGYAKRAISRILGISAKTVRRRLASVARTKSL